jgi:hypothetical protein
MGFTFPWEVDEVSTGKSSVETEPIGPCPDIGVIAGPAPDVMPPPMSEGGVKGPAATRIGALRAFGIGCIVLPWPFAETEPVVVWSAKVRPPSAVHPESAAAPATRPTNAAALSALPFTQLLISPLVRMYSTEPRLRH